MTKSGDDPRPAGRRTRKRRPEREPPALEEELTQTFHDLENEQIPVHLTELAERLDRAIARVVRKKTN